LGGVQVVNLVKPITSLKKLQVLLNLSPEIPEFVVGDEKRLMQTALNVVGNAVKFTKEGSISIKVCLERPDYPMDPLMLEFHPVQGEHHRYIRVEVWSLLTFFVLEFLLSHLIRVVECRRFSARLEMKTITNAYLYVMMNAMLNCSRFSLLNCVLWGTGSGHWCGSQSSRHSKAFQQVFASRLNHH
jgi:hypothetical protein